MRKCFKYAAVAALGLCLAACSGAPGQETAIEVSEEVAPVDDGAGDVEYKGTPSIIVKSDAEFVASKDGFEDWLQKRLNYPAASRDSSVGGVVKLGFTIDRKGKLVNPEILEGVAADIDKEVLRAVKLSPSWTPAVRDGQKVPEYVVMNIKFEVKKVEKKK